MNISKPKFETFSQFTMCSADIGSTHCKRVFFEVQAKYRPFHESPDPFLALSLMPAMKLGEDIFIGSTVSEGLYQNIELIQKTLLSWNEGFHKIGIHSEISTNPYAESKRGVGVFFSGGVDSFYSLLRNKEEVSERITHLILVHGFDIDYKDDKTFQVVNNAIARVAAEEGLELIVVKTNLRDFTDPILDWGFAHGGALGAISLLLRSCLRTIYIPSSYDYEALHPWGSHPDLDPLWGVGDINIIHDGTGVSRVRKTVGYIAKSDLALKHLRVCWKNERGRYNCGTCPKCIRTMIDLRIAGVLSKTPVFEKKLTPDLIKKADARGYGSRIFYEQSLAELLIKNNDPELIEALQYLLNREYTGRLQRLRDFIGLLDGNYNKHRLYKFLSKRGII